MLTDREAKMLVNIAFIAGWLTNKGCIKIKDGKAFFADTLRWAQEFESSFDSKTGNYGMEAVTFAFKHLMDKYGKEG